LTGIPVKRPSARVRAKQARIKQKFRTILLILVRNRNISTIKKGNFTTRRELFNRRNKKARASTLAFSEDRHFGQSQLNVTTVSIDF